MALMKKSTLLLLRLPFSYFLIPVFLFALCTSQKPVFWKAALSFFIIHFLLYTASNAFNSYYDRDKGSIGSLKAPPAVDKELLPVSLALDTLAVALGFIISWQFALGLFIYGLGSKAYSWDKIRLKKRPIVSLLCTGFGQGFLTYLLVYYGVQDMAFADTFNVQTMAGAFLSMLFLTASYPMTQIYQHQEDRDHGDKTISILLGIRGTFIFSAAFFSASAAGFTWFFFRFYRAFYPVVFLIFMALPAVYFFYWMRSAFKDPGKADYDHTMLLNIFSSTGLSMFLVLIMILENLHI